MLNKTRDEFRTKVPITVDKILKYIKKLMKIISMDIYIYYLLRKDCLI